MGFSGSGMSLNRSSGFGILKKNKSKILHEKVCARGWMPKITLGNTGLHEILSRDHGIEEPYSGPSEYLGLSPSLRFQVGGESNSLGFLLIVIFLVFSHESSRGLHSL